MVRTRSIPILINRIALIVAMIFGCGTAIAKPDQTSADYVMPGCRDVAALINFTNSESKEDHSRMIFCIGIVTGLTYVGQPSNICLPDGATSQLVIRAVVQYIDGQSPERMHESFNSLALEALRANWPCRNVVWRNW
jgi:Rap1a immunity proteins